MKKLSLAIVTSVLSLYGGVQAQESPVPEEKYDPEQVLAYQGDAVLTHAEIDAAFTNVPESHRLLYIRDGAKVDRLVRNLLRFKVLANEARNAGYQDDPVVQLRIQQAVERELAGMWLEKISLDARPADFETLAYERYLADPDAFKTEKMVDVSHILIGVEERSWEEAETRANEVLGQVTANPDQWDDLVTQYSDDPSSEHNNGRFPMVQLGQMTPAFEQAAFALENQGELSELVRTDYGFHIIRLNQIHSPRVREFEEIKHQVIPQVREKYLEQERAQYMRSVLRDPIEFPPGAIEIMARRHFGEDLELAPDYYSDAKDN